VDGQKEIEIQCETVNILVLWTEQYSRESSSALTYFS